MTSDVLRKHKSPHKGKIEESEKILKPAAIPIKAKL